MKSFSGSFQIRHVAMLCKYAGISFISGAVNHGMFSGERSLLTAALGVAVYIGGAILFRLNGDEKSSWRDLLGFGVLASVGLGFFTGGLQHFPDSPDRSVWVVPLGFVMSLWAFHALEGRGTISRNAAWRFGIVGSVVVLVGSGGAWWVFDHLGHAHDGHHH
jgi:hypothetical protein